MLIIFNSNIFKAVILTIFSLLGLWRKKKKFLELLLFVVEELGNAVAVAWEEKKKDF